MRNWRSSVTAILNTRCSSYLYITPALSTLHRTHPYIRRGTIEIARERRIYDKRKVEDEHIDMIERPVIGSTTLLTIVISMKGIPIIPLLSSHSLPPLRLDAPLGVSFIHYEGKSSKEK